MKYFVVLVLCLLAFAEFLCRAILVLTIFPAIFLWLFNNEDGSVVFDTIFLSFAREVLNS